VSNVHVYVKRLQRWSRVDADYYPMLHGEDAADAFDLVLRGARRTLATGRRSKFWITAATVTAEIRCDCAETMFESMRETRGEPGSVFTTLVPHEEAQSFVDAFEAIEAARR
jgi:hypothetical protein